MSSEAYAAGMINAIVEEGKSEEAILQGLRKMQEGKMEGKVRVVLQRYLVEMRSLYTTMLVSDDLGENVAGKCDGLRMYVDRSILLVGPSLEQTLLRAREVCAHEQYHYENGHAAPLIVMAEMKGDIAAVIGGVEFTETALIEGLTVKQTGDQFVSEKYLEYENMINRAMANAHLTVGDIEEAVNEKKNVMGIIDDPVPEQIAA